MLLQTHPSLQEYLITDPNLASPVISILPFMGSEGVSHDLPMGKKQNLGTGVEFLELSKDPTGL